MLEIQNWSGLGEWTKRAAMPGGRCEVAAVAVNGFLYVIGGSYFNFTNRSDALTLSLQRCERYDPARDWWSACAPLPEPRDHCALAAIGDVIYEFGGFTAAVHQGANERAFAYDTKVDRWREIAPMTVKRGSAGAAVVDGRIHVLGGRGPDGKTVVAAHEVYDPATDRWTNAAPLPQARDHMSVVEAGGKIHVIAGRTGAGWNHVDWHEVYDPKTDRWSSAPPLPTSRSATTGVLYKGKILVVGGELWLPTTPMPQPYFCYVDNEAYDVRSETWSTLRPLPSGRHAMAGAVVGDTAYFCGGSLKPGVFAGTETDDLLAFTLPD